MLVVLGAAALVATLPDARRADVPTVASTDEPVTRTVLACPSGRTDAVLRVASTAELPATRDGAVEVALREGRGQPRVLQLERGGLAAVEVGAEPVVLEGRDASARGLFATRAERVGSTLAAAGCVAPQPVWWFAGAGGGVDHASVLFLTNADRGPAVVDVRLHGATGSVDEAGLRGITLGPGQTRRVALDEVAPGSDELTVEVDATRGRVAAHLLDTLRTGETAGREWVPPSTTPADDVVLPGVREGADRAQLLVTNPGEDQALVELELLTESGAFVPLGTESLSVDPGEVERVDLTEELDGRAAAVRLRAQVPVAGAVRTFADGDIGYAGAAAPLTAPSGVVLAGARSELQVAATGEPVSLQLLVRDATGGVLLRRPVSVPPSGLVRIPLPGGADHVVLVPRSGGGHAATVHTGPGIAAQLTTPLPATVMRPTVRPWTGKDPG